MSELTDDLKRMQALGYTYDGRFFLMGEGEVTVERFNEVVGVIAPNGVTYEFSVTEDDEEV